LTVGKPSNVFIPCTPKRIVYVAAERAGPISERSAVLFAQVRKHVVHNPEHRDNHSNKQAKAHRDDYAFHGVDCKSMPVNWRNIAFAQVCAILSPV
jgi:hypothetical protein